MSSVDGLLPVSKFEITEVQQEPIPTFLHKAIYAGTLTAESAMKKECEESEAFPFLSKAIGNKDIATLAVEYIGITLKQRSFFYKMIIDNAHAKMVTLSTMALSHLMWKGELDPEKKELRKVFHQKLIKQYGGVDIDDAQYLVFFKRDNFQRRGSWYSDKPLESFS